MVELPFQFRFAKIQRPPRPSFSCGQLFSVHPENRRMVIIWQALSSWLFLLFHPALVEAKVAGVISAHAASFGSGALTGVSLGRLVSYTPRVPSCLHAWTRFLLSTEQPSYLVQSLLNGWWVCKCPEDKAAAVIKSVLDSSNDLSKVLPVANLSDSSE
jgi:hypothetical protein